MTKRKVDNDDGLPYFKFVISKWTTGNIQQCGLQSQGLFINLCVLYWGQRGELYLSKMLKRFPRKSKLFEELQNEGVIKLNEDKIVISFLDEQLTELRGVSEQNRKNANARWNQNKIDADALLPHFDGNAVVLPKEEIRKEEIRKEEIRKEENKTNAHAIENNDFKYEEPTSVPREATELTENILKYFAASSDVMSPIYSKVSALVERNIHCGKFTELTNAFTKYQEYKARSQEKVHSIDTWIGTDEAYFQDGAWTLTNWELKLNNLIKHEQQSTKGTNRTTSAKVSGNTYGDGLLSGGSNTGGGTSGPLRGQKVEIRHD